MMPLHADHSAFTILPHFDSDLNNMYRCVAKTSGAKAFLVHCIFLRNAQQNTAVAEDPTEPSFQKVYPKLPEVKVDKNFELPLSQIS